MEADAERNVVHGRVRLAGSEIGIRDLLVVARDGTTGRLGSAATDAEGRFAIEFRDTDFARTDARPRPDLSLTVHAPEGKDNKPLYTSPAARGRAARREAFLIDLDAKALVESGVAVPTDRGAVETPDDVAARMSTSIARETTLRASVRGILAERVDATRAELASIGSVVAEVQRSLTTVPRSARDSLAYVAPGEAVEDVSARVVKAGLARVEKLRRRMEVALTPTQLEELRAEFPDLTGIPFERVRPHLVGRDELPTHLVGDHPATLLCRDELLADDPCAAILRGGHPPSDDHPHDDPVPAPEPPPTAEMLDPDLIVAKLLQKVSVPEEATVFDVPPRASQADVDARVHALQLRSGPADTAAFHDVHSLQLAFDEVWQEVFDEELIDATEQLCREIVDLGGSLALPTGSSGGAVAALRAEARVVRRALARSGALMTSALGIRASDGLAPKTSTSAPWSGGLLDGLPWPFGEHSGPLGDTVEGGATVNAQDAVARVDQLLRALESKLREPHAFTIFGADRSERSINFGIIATYRQKWEPLAYQVGNLVKTVTLAPKETRKYSSKLIVRKKRSDKEAENRQEARRNESSDTQRAEAEIIRRAEAKTNFSLATEGTYNVLVSKGSATTNLGKDASTASDEIKRSVREAVLKATEEYKLERTSEVLLESSEDRESEESGEISNPNDELPVTYLFYELQRRYRISEAINRVTPVVLVAQEVPKPNEITEAWLVEHDWILSRVLLDDSFRPALHYLSNGMVGDERALSVLDQAMRQQRALVEAIKDELTSIRAQVGRRYGALERSIAARAGVVAGEGTEGFGDKAWDWLSGSADDESPEAARIREDAARDAYERLEREENEMRARLEREVTALQTATDTYTKALREHLNRRAQTLRLRLHVKQNILYYMQAIWSHEPPDQRFFRLHRVPVPRLSGTVTLTEVAGVTAVPRPPLWDVPPITFEASVTPDPVAHADLVEVCDLDNLIGFKGNYMMFALSSPNAITDWMMTPFLDGYFGLRDPDALGNWTLDGFSKYVCCLHEKVEAGELPQATFDTYLPGLREVYRRLLTDPRRSIDEVAVPSDSLYIEALPGSHPLLENFKLIHRAVDVKKAQAEVRAHELENVRAAARLLGDLLEDKDIEKKVIIEGDSAVVVPPEDA